jgi:radical SAM superfamily enzyme YgiQ (UPF0313 family)
VGTCRRFVASSGDVTAEVIAGHIRLQDAKPLGDDLFRIRHFSDRSQKGMNARASDCREKVLFIELSPSVPNLGRFIVMPRYGMMAIASIVAEKTGYNVTLLFEPYVGTIDFDRVAAGNPRYIMVNGLTTSASDNAAFLSKLRERLGRHVPVIAGGEHATMYPDDAARYADYVVLYEGDETVLELLEVLEETGARDQKLAGIPGLVYRDSLGTLRRNQEIRRVEKIDYRYDFRIVAGSRDAGKSSRFRLTQIPLQTSRGCKHYCSFCSWIGLYGKGGYRLRPIDDVLHDITHTIEYTGFHNFMVVDNLFGGDPGHTEELLGRIVRTFEGRTDKPTFTVLCRADQFVGGGNVFSDQFMTLMREAGVTHVSLGLESINEKSLVQMRKRTDLVQYIAAADRLHRCGFHIAATFVAGFDGDRYEDVLGIAEFAEKIGCFTIQIYSRTFTPKTSDEAMSGYRTIPGYLDKYFNGHTVNIFPTLMLPSTLQRAIFEAAFQFYEGKGPQKRLVGRIYKQVWKGIRPHYEALRRIEDEILLPEGIYVQLGGDGFMLREKALRAIVEDAERLAGLKKRIRGIFEEVSRLTLLDDARSCSWSSIRRNEP